jgi:hypothetical protein
MTTELVHNKQLIYLMQLDGYNRQLQCNIILPEEDGVFIF